MNHKKLSGNLDPTAMIFFMVNYRWQKQIKNKHMKKIGIKFTALAFAVALLAPASVLAQDEKEKEKVKEKKDVEQIVITRTNKDEKLVVEINGDKVTINGKPIEEYKNKEHGVGVSIHKLRSLDNLARIPGVSGSWNFNGNNNFDMFTEDANRAMLGVTTDESDKGAEINTVNKESAAEKMGLKKGDIITKVNEKNVADPDDLTAAIRSHKPGDKVTVTYLRDKKENTASGELGKWKSQAFKSMDMGNMNLDKVFPKVQGTPRVYAPNGNGQNWSWSGGGPKLGLSVQDTDEGKGVKVIEVDDESNAAKAGIKKDDVVTEVDGKAVNSTDDMVKMIKESKDKTSIMVKLQRAGKTQNIEVKIPKKIKTVDM